MNQASELLGRLFVEAQQSVSCSSRLIITGRGVDFITFQVGGSEEASITVSIHDQKIPTFYVTYPKLHFNQHGEIGIAEKTSQDILSTGVVWIVRKVFRFGFVPPEGYRRDHRSNTARAERDGESNDFDELGERRF